MPIVTTAIKTACLAMPLRKALVFATECDADGVTLDARKEVIPKELSETGLRHIRKLLEDQRLKVGAITFNTRLGYADPAYQEERLAATRAAMKLAFQLGSKVLSAPVGRIPLEEETDAWQTLLEAMLSLGKYGEHVGTHFAIQTTGASGAEVARLLQTLPEGILGADLHPANLIRMGESPSEAVELLGGRVLHVHACDAVRDFATKSTDETQLGRGTADFPSLLAQLEGSGYQGWATIERFNAATPEEFPLAVRYLRAIE